MLIFLISQVSENVSGFSNEILRILTQNQTCGAWPHPPFVQFNLFGKDRVQKDRGMGHCVAKLDDASGHVIGGGNETHATISVFVHPDCGFLGISSCIVGLVTEKNTAIRLHRRLSGKSQQLLHIDAPVDAGDEKLARIAFSQQFQSCFQAQAAAGQDDDCIGEGRRILDLFRNALQECEKTRYPKKESGADNSDNNRPVSF
jgi:hypothetical protein